MTAASPGTTESSLSALSSTGGDSSSSVLVIANGAHSEWESLPKGPRALLRSLSPYQATRLKSAMRDEVLPLHAFVDAFLKAAASVTYFRQRPYVERELEQLFLHPERCGEEPRDDDDGSGDRSVPVLRGITFADLNLLSVLIGGDTSIGAKRRTNKSRSSRFVGGHTPDVTVYDDTPRPVTVTAGYHRTSTYVDPALKECVDHLDFSHCHSIAYLPSLKRLSMVCGNDVVLMDVGCDYLLANPPATVRIVGLLRGQHSSPPICIIHVAQLKLIFTSSTDRCLVAWRDTDEGQHVALLKCMSPHSCLAYDVLMQWIIGGSTDGSITLYDTSGMDPINPLRRLRVFRGHRDWVSGVLPLYDGMDLVATSSYDGTVLLWDREMRHVKFTLSTAPPPASSPTASPQRSNEAERRTVNRSDGDGSSSHVDRKPLQDLSYSRQMRTLVTRASMGREVLVWNPYVSRPLETLSHASDRATIIATLTFPDSPELVTVEQAGRVSIWDMLRSQVAQSVGGSTDTVSIGEVNSACYCNHLSAIVALGEQGLSVFTPLRGSSDTRIVAPITAIVGASIRHTVIVATGTSLVEYRLVDRSISRSFAAKGHVDIDRVVISRDETTLLFSQRDGAVTVLNLAAWSVVGSFFTTDSQPPLCIADLGAAGVAARCSPSHARALTVSQNGKVTHFAYGLLADHAPRPVVEVDTKVRHPTTAAVSVLYGSVYVAVGCDVHCCDLSTDMMKPALSVRADNLVSVVEVCDTVGVLLIGDTHGAVYCFRSPTNEPLLKISRLSIEGPIAAIVTAQSPGTTDAAGAGSLFSTWAAMATATHIAGIDVSRMLRVADRHFIGTQIWESSVASHPSGQQPQIVVLEGKRFVVERPMASSCEQSMLCFERTADTTTSTAAGSYGGLIVPLELTVVAPEWHMTDAFRSNSVDGPFTVSLNRERRDSMLAAEEKRILTPRESGPTLITRLRNYQRCAAVPTGVIATGGRPPADSHPTPPCSSFLASVHAVGALGETGLGVLVTDASERPSNVEYFVRVIVTQWKRETPGGRGGGASVGPMRAQTALTKTVASATEPTAISGIAEFLVFLSASVDVLRQCFVGGLHIMINPDADLLTFGDQLSVRPRFGIEWHETASLLSMSVSLADVSRRLDGTGGAPAQSPGWLWQAALQVTEALFSPLVEQLMSRQRRRFGAHDNVPSSQHHDAPPIPQVATVESALALVMHAFALRVLDDACAILAQQGGETSSTFAQLAAAALLIDSVFAAVSVGDAAFWDDACESPASLSSMSWSRRMQRLPLSGASAGDYHAADAQIPPGGLLGNIASGVRSSLPSFLQRFLLGSATRTVPAHPSALNQTTHAGRFAALRRRSTLARRGSEATASDGAPPRASRARGPMTKNNAKVAPAPAVVKVPNLDVTVAGRLGVVTPLVPPLRQGAKFTSCGLLSSVNVIVGGEHNGSAGHLQMHSVAAITQLQKRNAIDFQSPTFIADDDTALPTTTLGCVGFLPRSNEVQAPWLVGDNRQGDTSTSSSTADGGGATATAMASGGGSPPSLRNVPAAVKGQILPKDPMQRLCPFFTSMKGFLDIMETEDASSLPGGGQPPSRAGGLASPGSRRRGASPSKRLPLLTSLDEGANRQRLLPYYLEGSQRVQRAQSLQYQVLNAPHDRKRSKLQLLIENAATAQREFDLVNRTANVSTAVSSRSPTSAISRSPPHQKNVASISPGRRAPSWSFQISPREAKMNDPSLFLRPASSCGVFRSVVDEDARTVTPLPKKGTVPPVERRRTAPKKSSVLFVQPQSEPLTTTEAEAARLRTERKATFPIKPSQRL